MKPQDIKSALTPNREKLIVSKECAVSTGSTLLNLACTEDPHCGFVKGGYYLLVGDSQSGKTWLSLSCFAEACLNPAFKDYRLVFDDVEGGAMMDVSYYFGEEVARRLEAPARTKQKEPVFSDTVESFYYHITDLIEDGLPFIYVLDSQDALTSESSSAKFEKQKKADTDDSDEKVAGSYGDGKAKYHSERLRLVLAGLRKTKSILIIISQTRDNLGMGFDPKTRSGGKALRFYANLEMWTSVKAKIARTVLGKERTLGARCIAEVKKNRFTGKVGKDRSVEIPIYYSLGIDDVGSMVDYLVSEAHWPLIDPPAAEKSRGHAPAMKGNRKKWIDAHDLLLQGPRESIVRQIEEDGLEERLKAITTTVWREIEDACRPVRKKRYE